MVYAHKSLILFRSIEREIRLDLNEDQSIAKLMKSKQIPEFFRQVYNLQPGQSLFLQGVYDKAGFVKLMEFLYCDKFVDSITPL